MRPRRGKAARRGGAGRGEASERSLGGGGGLPQAAASFSPRPHLPSPSDLALRNCLLTSDLTVRIGDYGLAHSNYKVGASLPHGGEGC